MTRPPRYALVSQDRFVTFALFIVTFLTVAVSTTAITTSRAAFSSTAQSSFDVATKPGYRQTIINDGPVSYWRLGEAPGSTFAVDEMGVATLSYRNAPQLGQTGALSASGNSAMTTSGTQQAGSPINNPEHNLTAAVSVETWIKPSVATQFTNARAVSKYGSSTVNYLLAYDGGGTRMRFLVDLNPTGRPTAISTTALTNTNHWYHVVGTYDGSAVRIYIDGVQEHFVSASLPLKTINSGISIANEANGPANVNFRGTIDEVSIWNRALTPAEITNHRNRGLGL